MAGPTLHSVYASTMRKCILDNVDLHGYADNRALEQKFLCNDINSESHTKHVLENSLKSMLRMNDTKTVCIFLDLDNN